MTVTITARDKTTTEVFTDCTDFSVVGDIVTVKGKNAAGVAGTYLRHFSDAWGIDVKPAP